mmetsp:Transcript_20969/g.52518  ORF Transcript_20969/g.52518 Transcript_20969/m.52518 type:complete len:222 (+) Transcript_20969:870-1535(+)
MDTPHRQRAEHHQLPYLHGHGPAGQQSPLGRLCAVGSDVDEIHSVVRAHHALAEALHLALPTQGGAEEEQRRGPPTLAGRGGGSGGGRTWRPRPRRGVRVRGDFHSPDHRDHRVCLGHSVPHRLLSPYLGIVIGAPAVVPRVLPEDPHHGLGDVLPCQRHHALLHVRGMVRYHVGRALGHGRARVLLAHIAVALGRVPEQVLQGRRREVCSLQHPQPRRWL